MTLGEVSCLMAGFNLQHYAIAFLSYLAWAVDSSKTCRFQQLRPKLIIP